MMFSQLASGKQASTSSANATANLSKPAHNNPELLATLQLISSENLGPRTFFSLVRTFGSPERALDRASELAAQGRLGSKVVLAKRSDVLLELERAAKYGATIIHYNDSRYPALLKETANYPPVITILGNRPELLAATKLVAIIGSRSPSINGNNFANKIASELSELGYVVVSGFARGIDTYAHLGALNAKQSNQTAQSTSRQSAGTIAVTACGIDQIYPPENKDLYKKIAEGGLILTEQPFGSSPKAAHFPQRNRIISGLSLATIVIEAGLKSGSLITAKFAAEQNREVFATPGFPLDYRYAGTNQLIKQGAYLLETVDDIVNVLEQQQQDLFGGHHQRLCVGQRPPEPSNSDFLNAPPSVIASPSGSEAIQPMSNQNEKDLDKLRKLVLSRIGSMPVAFDTLAATVDVAPNQLSVVLVELELEGRVDRVGSNQFILVS